MYCKRGKRGRFVVIGTEREMRCERNKVGSVQYCKRDREGGVLHAEGWVL